MKVEPAAPGDETRVKELLAACGLPYEDIAPLHLQHFLVLRDGPRLAGVIGLEVLGKCALLRSLAVPASQRGKGIGSQLTRQVETYALSQQIETLYLLTTTAEGFFAGRGYRRAEREAVPAPIQETAEFRSLCPSTAVCMVKHLEVSKLVDW